MYMRKYGIYVIIICGQYQLKIEGQRWPSTVTFWASWSLAGLFSEFVYFRTTV